MARKEPFVLSYDPEVNEHLRAIETKYHSLIRRDIGVKKGNRLIIGVEEVEL